MQFPYLIMNNASLSNDLNERRDHKMIMYRDYNQTIPYLTDHYLKSLSGKIGI